LAFGEDYELLAATSDPREFTVIGRCEPGSGVEIRMKGRPRSPIRVGAFSLARKALSREGSRQ
jgi:hypothetical protein